MSARLSGPGRGHGRETDDRTVWSHRTNGSGAGTQPMGDSGRKGRGWLAEEGLMVSSDLTVSSDLRKG